MSLVYTLTSNADPMHIRYVGRTIHSDTIARLRSHLSRARKGGNWHVYNWIRQVLANNDEIVISVIEEGLSEKDSKLRETYYIEYYRSLGHKLTNMTAGGEGASSPTAEVRFKMGGSGKERVVTQETRDKISKATSGRTLSEDHKKKISTARTGVPMTEETKQKIRVSSKDTREPWSDERRKAYGERRTGEKRSEEAKQKMRENKLKYWEQRKEDS